MVIHSRDHPSRAEYLYLVILQDYVTATLDHLGAAKDQLSRLLPEPVPPELEPRKTDILKDMDYLIESSHQVTKHLAECQQQAKSLEELKQNQIAGIISFLVAIYVPVAFVSSYFGMNTTEILNGDLHNVTFWEISIPLMILTIMLPLSLTIIARVARGISLSAGVFSLQHWLLIVDICITLFFLSLLFAHIVHWRLSGDSNFAVFFTRISSSETLIVDCLFAGFFLLKAIENSILRNRRGRLWFYYFLTISFVATLCAGLSLLENSIATMVAPIVFTLLALAVRPLLF